MDIDASPEKVVNKIRRQDYTAPTFLIETVNLHFHIVEEETVVTSILSVRRESFSSSTKDLVLNGEGLTLISVFINDTPLTQSQYNVTDHTLALFNVPDAFTLKTTVRIYPGKNTALSGLYKSAQHFCTQCEAEGFRRITYFLDRPDVLSLYTTTIVADRKRYPHLLSNGNLLRSELLADGYHAVTWVDPFKKPCYLFALVAGDFDLVNDTFETCSKRKVDLRLYVEKGLSDQTSHAMHALKAAMRWDEERYHREYDLDLYMIVAIGDFNMGAMENKGLNIFNTKYILAKPETATDDDYIHIASVIAHEYFHNWSGNRVTCRDWFQLSLKEGLTIFRDQSFTEDTISKAVMRIWDVKALREVQFPEDAGPTAHSVRPDSYIEINNFYTATIYNKGAEVLRMLRTIVGDQVYYDAMDQYFLCFDGQAVTIDDYIEVMQIASGKELTQFKRWYSEAGTPLVNIQGAYHEKTHCFRLTCTQSCPPTPDQPSKLPLHIPIRMSLFNQQGKKLFIKPGESECLIQLTDSQEVVEFNDIDTRPIPSLLRGFSAPIKLNYAYTDDELLLLSSCDDDPFSRYEALQQYLLRLLQAFIRSHQMKEPYVMNEQCLTFFSQLLTQHATDPFFVSELLQLPSEKYIGEQMHVIDVDAIHAVREVMLLTLSTKLNPLWEELYYKYDNEVKIFQFSANHIGKRQFKNACFSYLLCQAKYVDLAMKQFKHSFKKNMTDQLAALNALSHFDVPEREMVLQQFYDAWSQDALVMDKWFSIQAMAKRKNVVDDVQRLISHPLFDLKNPNKVYALIGAFGHRNITGFHNITGSGYELVCAVTLELDHFNPQIAARMVTPLLNWRRYDPIRQQLMQNQLELILQRNKLSKDLYELVSKSLQ